MARTKTTISLDASLCTQAKLAASHTHRKFSGVVEELLFDWLKKLEGGKTK